MYTASPTPSGQESANHDQGQGTSENGANIRLSQLTRRQVLALPILAAAPNLTQGARDAGISESTLYRWRQDENFRKQLHQLTIENAELTRQELKTLTRQSYRVFSELMEDPDPTVRLRAARAVAVMGLRVIEVDNRHLAPG